MRNFLQGIWLGAVLLVASRSAMPATATFTAAGTATSSAGSSGAVNATITFTTFNAGMTVTIQNNLAGITRDIQTISAIEFVLSGGQTTGTISARSGVLRTVNADGTWAAAGSFTTGWQVQAGSSVAACTTCLTNSMDLNTFTGGSPIKTIIGPPNSSNQYKTGSQTPNKALTSHNPYIATDLGAPVQFTITTAVLDSTTVTRLRVFFGTDRTAPFDATSSSPEPGSVILILTGLVASASMIRHQRNRS